jgi:uncharacterized protein YlxW (UPF0749 family)
MKKKLITIFMVFCLVFTVGSISTSAVAKVSQYTKVKTTTYVKYKKAYKELKEIKKENKELKKELKTQKEKVKDQKSMNSWLWMNIKSLGISYNKKTWTIPASYPSQFMINGATYKVKEK